MALGVEDLCFCFAFRSSLSNCDGWSTHAKYKLLFDNRNRSPYAVNVLHAVLLLALLTCGFVYFVILF